MPFNSRLSEEREFAATPERTVRTRMLVCQHMRVPFARYAHPRHRLSMAALPLRLERPAGLALELDLLLPDSLEDFQAFEVFASCCSAFGSALESMHATSTCLCVNSSYFQRSNDR